MEAIIRKIRGWGKRQLKIFAFSLDNFNRLGLTWQAVALSYFSTMAFVPMLAVIFSITNELGMSNLVHTILQKYISNQEAMDTIMGFADNIIASTAQPGIYGVVSVVVFLWLIFWTMLCAERSFNTIWLVEKSRILWKRALSYIFIFILAPFIFILFLVMILTIAEGLQEIILLKYEFLDIKEIILWCIFYILATLVFFCMFKFVPNAKVKSTAALRGALTAALAFTAVQSIYLKTQILVSSMNAIYGVFATIPLFMVWVNIGWYIIIYGALLTYCIQHLDEYPREFCLSDLKKLNFLKKTNDKI